MAIDTTQLIGTAEFRYSKKGFVRDILDMVLTYNLMPAANAKLRLERLDKIMLGAAAYLTAKRPTAKVKNQARWAALANLAGQCSQEAQLLGAKQLTSPHDFRDIRGDPKLGQQSYWLERMDPQHRAGFTLSAKYEEWMNSTSDEDFWTYSANVALGDRGVKLLDETQKVRRLKYLARMNINGSLRDLHDEPVSTYHMHSTYGGEGWGIFVLSPEGELYIHSHKVGRFHHSTFLGGGAVAAAGEICVDMMGSIRVISNKTGHYKAGITEMQRMVQMIPIDSEAIILPDLMRAYNPPLGTGEVLFYRVGDFRAHGVGATPLSRFTVSLRIPVWARSAQSPTIRRMLAKIA